MGRRKKQQHPWAGVPHVTGTFALEDFEIEADDGADLIEQIREAQACGRDFYIETDQG